LSFPGILFNIAALEIKKINIVQEEGKGEKCSQDAPKSNSTAL